MQQHMPTYGEAMSVLKEFNQGESLLKHAYAVEATMAYLAGKYGEDVEKWSVTAVLHGAVVGIGVGAAPVT